MATKSISNTGASKKAAQNGYGKSDSLGKLNTSSRLDGSSGKSGMQGFGTDEEKDIERRYSAANNANADTKSVSKSEKSLETLFEDVLKDTLSAERQLVEALPGMAEAASSEILRDAFQHHLKQTKRQVERLEKVFSKLRIPNEENPCEAMKGLIKENETVIEEYEEGPVRDSALIIGSQKVEHYEIAAYGSLCELADVLGHNRIADLLSRSMVEEEETDRLLTEIAMNVNDEAYEISDPEETE